MSVAGSCLCGGVRFHVEGALRPVIACHCRQCRKTSGHYAAATAAARADIRFETEKGLRWHQSSPTARRGFCAICGSNLFWEIEGRDAISIFAGCLEGETGLHVARHIHCADKGDYYQIDGDAPQHPGGRG